MAGRGSPGSGDWTQAFRSCPRGPQAHQAIRAHAFESPGKGGKTGEGWEDRGLAARSRGMYRARPCPGHRRVAPGRGRLFLMCRCGDGLDRDQLTLGFGHGLRVHQNFGVLGSAARVPDPKSDQDRHEGGENEGGDCSPQSDQTKL
jgi:hypothetical protein